MTESVVDVLEAVEVETEHRHEAAVMLGAGDGAIEMLTELHTVRQAGQGVVQGKIADLIFRKPALADTAGGDRSRHGEAHDDEKAGRERGDSQSDIGESGGASLIDRESMDPINGVARQHGDKGNARG